MKILYNSNKSYDELPLRNNEVSIQNHMRIGY